MAHLMQPESHSAASVEDQATPTDASRVPTPPLPYDVLLEILGHLGDTANEECASGLYSSVQFMKKKQAKKALVACSLTSRALRKFTLPHLFRTLKLSFESLQDDYRTTNRPTEEHCCRCLTILDALKFFESHPTLGSYVRELTMTATTCRKDPDFVHGILVPHGVHLDATVVVQLLHAMPRLRTLELKDVVFDGVEAMNTLNGCVSLNRLTLRRNEWREDTNPEAANVFGIVDQVDEIRLFGFSSSAREASKPSLSPGRLNIRSESIASTRKLLDCHVLDLLALKDLAVSLNSDSYHIGGTVQSLLQSAPQLISFSMKTNFHHNMGLHCEPFNTLSSAAGRADGDSS